MIGKRLARARAAMGLSMEKLGEKVGVSANMIKKYEHDVSMPTSGKLIQLAKALDVRSEYFFRPTEIILEGIEYRKHPKVPDRVLKRIAAKVLDQAERWYELNNLWPQQFPVQSFRVPQQLPKQISSLDAVDKLADHVRKAWYLGLNPIPDLIDTLELQGILVIVINEDESTQFDGLQATISNQPVIVVSSHWPGDRQRFTLTHELGHLLLNGRLVRGLDEEAACHRFAASFLLPAAAVRQQLGDKRHNIEFQELYLLKGEFGLSMQACLRRAAELTVIDTKVFKKLHANFTKQGWRKQEPGTPYRQEQTQLFQQLVYRALGENIIGESKAAELLSMPLSLFHQNRKLEGASATVSQ